MYNQNNYQLPVIVIQGSGKSLLGRNWFAKMQIEVHGVHVMDVKNCNCENLCEMFPNVMNDELGAHQGPPVGIQLNDDARPVFLKHRQVPFAVRKLVDAELQRLVQQGVLEPTEFSKWATPVVAVVKKDKSIRICGDYRSTVNSVMKSNAYPLPTSSEVMEAVSTGKFFSKLDLQQAYQQLVVDDNSAEVLTLNTHKGLFKVRRLPFGISAAPGIFQRFMDNLLKGVPGVVAYLDDILVSGSNESEHFNRLTEVFRRLEASKLTVRREKCVYLRRNVFVFLVL